MFLLLLLLACLGAAFAASRAIQLARAAWIVFLRPGKDLRSYGSWALVTGAGDGIGRAFACELAAAGINLVLVGRCQPKLQQLREDLQARHGGVSVRLAIVDFADEDLRPSLERISEQIRDVEGELGILINNVGVSYPYARFFHEVDAALLESLLRVNIRATTLVTQLLLPAMLQRKKGAIVNVGSGSASILPADPLYSVYAASKGYVELLSRSLYVEYKHSGIDVQCQVPLYVKTRMAKIKRTSLTVPSPELYAKWALRSIGYEAVSTPFWAHHLIWWLISILPQSLVDAVRLRSNLDVRRRGQLKESKAV